MAIPVSREQLKDWCLDNKYTKWYCNIIDNAISRGWTKNVEVYMEKHHILPKSILKNNSTVYVTAREHFICHLLLPKMLKDVAHTRKMNIALHRLIHGNKYDVYYTSSRTYAIVKKWHSEAASERSKDYWNALTAEQRSKMRSGENNGRYGKLVSELTRNKISQANTGRLAKEKHPLWNKGHSAESKILVSKNRKGKTVGVNNPMYGKDGAAKNKTWYHDPSSRVERYFVIGSQPKNFIRGRLRNV